MKRLILASSLFFASVAHAVPSTYWKQWYEPFPDLIDPSYCSVPFYCKYTAPVGIRITADDVGRSVVVSPPPAMHCPNLTTKDGTPLYSPIGREMVEENRNGAMMGPSFSFDVGMWTCEDAQNEGRSRLYWIETWKKERARVQTLEAQIRALKAKCGSRCR